MTTPRKETLDASLVKSAQLICEEYKAEVRPAFSVTERVYIVRVNDSVGVLALSNSTTEVGIRNVLNDVVSGGKES